MTHFLWPKMNENFDIFLGPRATHSSCLSESDLESLIIDVAELVLNSCIREAIIWRLEALSNLKIGTSSVSCTVRPILSMILIISLPADGDISFALYPVFRFGINSCNWVASAFGEVCPRGCFSPFPTPRCPWSPNLTPKSPPEISRRIFWANKKFLEKKF